MTSVTPIQRVHEQLARIAAGEDEFPRQLPGSGAIDVIMRKLLDPDDPFNRMIAGLDRPLVPRSPFRASYTGPHRVDASDGEPSARHARDTLVRDHKDADVARWCDTAAPASSSAPTLQHGERRRFVEEKVRAKVAIARRQRQEPRRMEIYRSVSEEHDLALPTVKAYGAPILDELRVEMHRGKSKKQTRLPVG